MVNKCPCGNKYQFTEHDRLWNTLNTICPKCTMSLNAQEFTKEVNQIISKGLRAKYVCILTGLGTGWLDGNKIVTEDKQTILYGI